MTIDYYIGVAVGIFSILVAYAVSRLTRRDSICDRCEHLKSKDWTWQYFCSKEGCHYFAPKYCCYCKEKENEHGIT